MHGYISADSVDRSAHTEYS